MLIDRHHGPQSNEERCPDGLQGRAYIRVTIGLTFEEHRALLRESRRQGISVAKLARMAVTRAKVPE